MSERTTNEIAQAAIALLQSIVEHKRRARSWEQEFYPISTGTSIRPGAPDLQSPEVQVLIKNGLVQFVATSTNDAIPDDSLRLLNMNEPQAEELIRRYADLLQSAVASELKLKSV